MADDATISNASANIIRALTALTAELNQIKLALHQIAKNTTPGQK